MDAQPLASRRSALRQIYRQLMDWKSVFLSPSNLQSLGIQASQVGITDDGTLQFQPCLFRPYPERVLALYPLHPSVTADDLPKLNPRPEFDRILQECVSQDPNAKDNHEVAREWYEELMALVSPDEWGTHAQDTRFYIRKILDARRQGRPEFSSLLDLASLTRPPREESRGDPPTEECRIGRPFWRAKDLWDNSHKNPPLPHAIMATIAHVPASYQPGDLTIHEVRAIVSMMIIRTSHRPFRNYAVHPLLLLSYMGQNHGRIIQAACGQNGNSLLQYSQLWSFENDETAPVELFVRYNIGQLVGLERSQLDVPELRKSVASMNLD